MLYISSLVEIYAFEILQSFDAILSITLLGGRKPKNTQIYLLFWITETSLSSGREKSYIGQYPFSIFLLKWLYFVSTLKTRGL